MCTEIAKIIATTAFSALSSGAYSFFGARPDWQSLKMHIPFTAAHFFFYLIFLPDTKFTQVRRLGYHSRQCKLIMNILSSREANTFYNDDSRLPNRERLTSGNTFAQVFISISSDITSKLNKNMKYQSGYLCWMMPSRAWLEITRLWWRIFSLISSALLKCCSTLV